MAEVKFEIDLSDETSIGNKVFANVVDANNLNTLISRIKDTKEKRSMSELLEAFLQGK